MKTGTVSWFNNCLGYGFVKPDDGSEDVYVHHSETETDQDNLFFHKGQRVAYELMEDSLFPFACRLERIVTAEVDYTG